MDHAIDQTPVMSEMAPARRDWFDRPFPFGGGFFTYSVDDLHAAREHRGRNPKKLTVDAPTQLQDSQELEAQQTPISPKSQPSQRGAMPTASGADFFTRATASQRTRLLAMKYAQAAPNAELLARIAILDARIGRLVPRVEDGVRNAVSAELKRWETSAAELDAILASI